MNTIGQSWNYMPIYYVHKYSEKFKHGACRQVVSHFQNPIYVAKATLKCIISDMKV